MNIFITGNPGCGKSTLIQKLLDALSDKKVTGIITPEIRSGGSRQGFRIIDLASRQEEVLASPNLERGPGVSKYRVNVAGIERILDKFHESYASADYVVIDEIGMMEFYSPKFRETIGTVLASDKRVIATLSRRLLKEFKDRGQVFHLTRDNFNRIYHQVLSLLREA